MNKFILIILISITSTFSYADEWKRVYLATYPRSGNHWIRYLIEECTGIATASVYRDVIPLHMENPFEVGFFPPNGYEQNRIYPTREDIIFIKTHYPCMPSNQFDLKKCTKTIRVVRNPIDSFYSAHIYPGNNNLDKKMSIEFIKRHIKTWEYFQTYWNNQEDLLTIRYEDLLKDPLSLLKIILQESGYHCTEDDIERAVRKYPPKNNELQHISHYEQSDIDVIKLELNTLLNQFNYHLP